MGFFDKFSKKVVSKDDIKLEADAKREEKDIPNSTKNDTNSKNKVIEPFYANHTRDREPREKKCTKCGCDLKEYIYGMPTLEKNNGEYIMAGCIKGMDAPVYHCDNCNIDFDGFVYPILNSLEEAINEYVGEDPFWAEIIKKYFAEEVEYDEKKSIKLLEIVTGDKEIFDEFIKYLMNKSYDIENPIIVEGKTAKDMVTRSTNMSVIEAYALMANIRAIRK